MVPGFRFGTVLPVCRLVCLAGIGILVVSDRPAAREATIAAKETRNTSNSSAERFIVAHCSSESSRNMVMVIALTHAVGEPSKFRAFYVQKKLDANSKLVLTLK
jgi:hypothetical protein